MNVVCKFSGETPNPYQYPENNIMLIKAIFHL